jgi:DNA repair exonuclease SbcCD nuclease subunit
LTKDLAGRKLNAPVFYPGSTERTSFAERLEEKGYLILTITPNAKDVVKYQFVPLYARPMIDLDVTTKGCSLEQVQEKLTWQIAAVDANAIVRVRTIDGVADAIVSALNDRWLRSVAPESMNISWSYVWQRDEGAH